MPPLDGRVALVSVAGSGIGRATALRLAADGPSVGPGGDAYVGQVLSPNGGTVFPG